MGLIIFAVAIGFYAFICYIFYRVVAKFDDSARFGEFLLPVWNCYMLLRVAVSNPVAYFWILVASAVFFAIIGGVMHSEVVSGIGQLIGYVMWARAFGLIAEKLGKNFWLYAVPSILPIIGLLVLIILAFSNSRPVTAEQNIQAG